MIATRCRKRTTGGCARVGRRGGVRPGASAERPPPYAPGRRRPVSAAPRHQVGPTDWPSFGNGPEHDFVAPTSITAADVGTLHEAWFFPTGDAVTATPTIVNGVAYFGSWDTKFYAVPLATGKLKWSYPARLARPPSSPTPARTPAPTTSDGGLVTSSAWYEPADTSHPDLVIFGGGFTLYALDADTGTLFWKHVYDGLPSKPPSPTTDQTRIFSSPIVEDGNVYVGVDNDGESGERGYIVAANLLDRRPGVDPPRPTCPPRKQDPRRRVRERSGRRAPISPASTTSFSPSPTATTATPRRPRPSGSSPSTPRLDGCGGRPTWSASDPGCDFDETGTNAGLAAERLARTSSGPSARTGPTPRSTPRPGRCSWSNRVVFGGSAGGFIGSPAYAGSAIYGATAIGDVGEPVRARQLRTTPRIENPSFFAIDAATGQVLVGRQRRPVLRCHHLRGWVPLHRARLRRCRPGARCRTPGRWWPRCPTQLVLGAGSPSRGDMVVMGVGSSASGNPAGVVAFKPSIGPARAPGPGFPAGLTRPSGRTSSDYPSLGHDVLPPPGPSGAGAGPCRVARARRRVRFEHGAHGEVHAHDRASPLWTALPTAPPAATDRLVTVPLQPGRPMRNGGGPGRLPPARPGRP